LGLCNVRIAFYFFLEGEWEVVVVWIFFSSFILYSQVLEKCVQIRTIMVENIEKILERGDRIELLVDKTATMQDGAFHFKKQSKRLRRALWMKNAKLL
jgi:hypothetical protein